MDYGLLTLWTTYSGPWTYRSNMEMSGYMSDYIFSFTNISGSVTAYIFL